MNTPLLPRSPRSRAAWTLLFLAGAGLAPLGAQQAAPATPADATADQEAALKLSPFVVNTDRDVGFVAANSLAGGRMSSDLADTPVAYSVQTKEFLDALNLTNLDDAFEWTVNATKYVDDQQAGIALGVDALSNSTVRGVLTNGPMRNFFNISYSFDAYNSERFDYMRGPNSILFGAGTISGSANMTSKFGLLGRTIDEVRLQADSHGSIRFTADVNRPIGDRVAVRIAVVRDDGKTWRDGEVKNKTGVSPSVAVHLTRTTDLKIAGEYATDFTRQMISPLRDSLSGWDGTTFGLQSLAGSSTTQATYNIHGVQRVGSSTAPNVFIFSPDHSQIVNYAGTVSTLGYNTNMRAIDGLVPVSGSLNISNAPLIDLPTGLPTSLQDLYAPALQSSNFRIPSRQFTNLGTAPIGTNRDKDLTLSLTQRVGDSLFFELAGDINRRNNYGNGSYWYSDAVTGFGATFIDVNQTTPTGAKNPEFLEPYQQAGLDRRFQDYDYRAAHLAAGYVHDWRWVSLKFSAMGGVDRDSSLTVREIGVLPINADPRQWGLNNANSFPVYYRMYFDQTARQAPPMEAPISVVNPQTGTTTSMTPLWTLSTSRTEGGVIKQIKNTDYGQAAAQLQFWKKRITLLGAIRYDRLSSAQKLGLRAESYPAGWVATNNHYLWRPDAPANWATLAPSRPLDSSGVPLAANANTPYQNDYNPPKNTTADTTKSIGGIVQLGHGFALTANYSQTFNPPNITVLTINYGTPPPSVSDGVDFGIRYSLPNGRVNASLSHYSSTTNNNTSGQPPGFSSFNTILSTTAINNDIPGGINSRGLGLLPSTGWADVDNLKAQGYEAEIVANFTREWRLTANVGTANSTQNNTYQQTRAYLAANNTTLRQILTDAGVVLTGNVASVPPNTPATPSSSTAVAGANAWNTLQANAANWVTGTQLLSRMTKYTANIYTDYTFARTLVKGLRLGGGLQYRGPQVIGYRGADTIPNPANPAAAIDDPNVSAYTAIWARSYGIATFTAAYPVKIFGDHKVLFNATLNNAFNYNRPLYNNTNLRPYNGNLASPARTTVPLDYTYVIPRTLVVSATYNF